MVFFGNFTKGKVNVLQHRSVKVGFFLVKKLSIIQSKSVRNRAFVAIHQIQLNAKTHLLKHKDCHLKHKDSVQ